MNNTIWYGTRKITYTITKSNRKKTSQITVDKFGVYVRVPFSKKNSEIMNMMDDKKRWIFSKQDELTNNKKVIKMSKRSSDYLEKRTWKLAYKIGLIPTNVNTKRLRSRWGSCTKTGIINLNAALSNAPTPVIDYVIIHELCHLKIRDHSKQYWILVSKFMADYEKKLEWLKSNAMSIL